MIEVGFYRQHIESPDEQIEFALEYLKNRGYFGIVDSAERELASGIDHLDILYELAWCVVGDQEGFDIKWRHK